MLKVSLQVMEQAPQTLIKELQKTENQISNRLCWPLWQKSLKFLIYGSLFEPLKRCISWCMHWKKHFRHSWKSWKHEKATKMVGLEPNFSKNWKKKNKDCNFGYSFGAMNMLITPICAMKQAQMTKNLKKKIICLLKSAVSSVLL